MSGGLPGVRSSGGGGGGCAVVLVVSTVEGVVLGECWVGVLSLECIVGCGKRS